MCACVCVCASLKQREGQDRGGRREEEGERREKGKVIEKGKRERGTEERGRENVFHYVIQSKWLFFLYKTSAALCETAVLICLKALSESCCGSTHTHTHTHTHTKSQ